MTSLVVNPRFDFTVELPPLARAGAVHFIGIGGSGMSGIAHLFASAGLTVTGCDGAESDAVAGLRAAGVAVTIGHDAAHVDGVDTLVVSSAIPETNPELAAARARGIRVLHRAQALAMSMGDRVRIAVAGANGKTTTSAMVATALLGAGLDPSYAIGSPLVATGVSSAIGAGRAFVVEADESDSSFLTYHPHIAVVTNVQPDHLDFYGDFAHVEEAYAAFAATIPAGGLLVAGADDPGSARLAARAAAAGTRVLTYGESYDADVRIEDVILTGAGGAARVVAGDQGVDLRIAAPGRHNLANAVAALTVGWFGLGADPAALAKALESFAGTRRRFEVKGTVRGITVVDDYAHNAPKVAALVSAARAVAGDGAVRLVFQPHLYSRTRDFAAQFAAGLAGADQVVLLPVYGAREQPMPGVDSHLIAEALAALGSTAELVERPEQAVAALARRAQSGDLVLTVGAGDVTRLAPALLAALAMEGDPS